MKLRYEITFYNTKKFETLEISGNYSILITIQKREKEVKYICGWLECPMTNNSFLSYFFSTSILPDQF